VKVRRKSWHYRLSHLLGNLERRSDNLCAYFWRMVVVLLVLSFILFCVFQMVYTLFMNPATLEIMIFVSVIVLIFAAPPISIYYLRKWLGHSPELPAENIFIEFAKAKKRKVCPLIEYVD